MVEIPGKQEETQAEFNNALAFLERLNRMEYQIEDNLIKWDLHNALRFLESYENEIAFCFKEGEQEEINKLKNEIIQYFNQYPGMGRIIKQYGQKKILYANITPIVRMKLIELNKYLRMIKYKRGMGMPKKGESKLF
jgi:hypothetical protein